MVPGLTLSPLWCGQEGRNVKRQAASAEQKEAIKRMFTEKEAPGADRTYLPNYKEYTDWCASHVPYLRDTHPRSLAMNCVCARVQERRVHHRDGKA